MADFDTRQQLLADQLRRYQSQAQTQAPQGRQVGRVYVAPNPLEYLAAGLRSYGGMKGEQQTQQAIGDLAEKRRAAMVEQLRGFGQAMQGTPEVPAADVADGPGQTFTAPAIPAKAGDPMAAYSQLLGSDIPELQKVGMQGMAAVPEMQARQQERAADRTFRADQAASDRQFRLDQLAAANQARLEQTQMAHQLRMDQLAAQNASREQMAQAQREFQAQQLQAQQEFQREMKKLGGAMAAAGRQPEPLEQVLGEDGRPVFVRRSEAVGKTPFSPSASGKAPGQAADKPLTESQAKGALYLGQMRSASSELAKQPQVSPVATAATGSTWTNWAAPKEAQKVAQLQNQWAEAYLRAKTGAAATQGEVDLNRRTFFPVVGDSAEVIKQKKQMREQAERDMEFTAGSAAKIAGQQPAAPAALSPEDTQAREWALQNPNDPRAKQIMQRLGG